jgi:hypothetical protein
MKRSPILSTLCVGCLLFGVIPGQGKKKPEKPVLESFDATVTPSLGVFGVNISIEEFSTEEEIQDLARTFSKGGEDAIENALGKVRKGYVRMQSGEALSIRLIRSRSAGGVRTLNIVSVAADRIVNESGGQTFIGHRGYPYTFIQLQIDERGMGKGTMVPFAKLTFDRQGGIEVKPMEVGSGSSALFRLINVHPAK